MSFLTFIFITKYLKIIIASPVYNSFKVRGGGGSFQNSGICKGGFHYVSPARDQLGESPEMINRKKKDHCLLFSNFSILLYTNVNLSL